ncbi:SulP family inorganic anion transporter [Dethiobacter alkaliphilus]|uniref:Sulphate transporter n=1 Tax=Dethiobacter alkaliphilus AHT 1 TaxID=555088 RepID=C0GJ45_DETAL|nr:SulP family inorganic anion transporter [Dethiobacter alkaliphilus]EEG76678.1 sulphate transporter [Dethiobacter alkaliphilus AHT 1]
MAANNSPQKGPWIAEFSSTIKTDLPASLVTFLVALPLSLGIALASGAPLMAGVIAAVVGGIVVGALGGAPMQVSGPAAGLTVIIFGLVQQFGWEVTSAMTVSAGILQIILGKLGVAPLAMAISPAVLHGMLAAIGILIALSQAHVVLGAAPAGGGTENLLALPGSIINLDPATTVLGLLTIGILVFWPKIKLRRMQIIPGSLAAVVIATIVSLAFGMNIPRVELAGGNLFASISLPVLPTGNYTTFVAGIFVLTLVASAESLLCAVATDKLHTGPRCCLHKELMAQGAGNTISGLLGGLPITGVIVRSKASISAGAKTRASAILHGLWILIFVVLLPGLVTSIPLSVLAGLLVYTGIQLVNFHHVTELRRYQEMIVYLITVIAIVGINLLAGLGIGLAAALIRLLWKLTRMDIAIEKSGGAWHVTISGALTFAGIPKLTSRLADIPPSEEVKIHLALRYLDHAGCEALNSWQESYEKQGGRVQAAALEENWSSCQPGKGENSPLVACNVFEDIWTRNNGTVEEAMTQTKQEIGL